MSNKSTNLPVNRQTQASNVPTEGKKLRTIIKIKKHTNSYVPIATTTLQDERLSFKARGILSYLLSLPDDWTVKLNNLASASPQGIKAIRSSFRELRTYGYAKLDWVKDENNNIRSQYFVSEIPIKDWIEKGIEEEKKGDSYTVSAFQQKFTRDRPASALLHDAKTIFIQHFAITFYAKFSFDRQHTRALKRLLLAIVDSVDEYFKQDATHEQIMKGFTNLLSKAVKKYKKPKQFTPAYILHTLHSLRSHDTLLD